MIKQNDVAVRHLYALIYAGYYSAAIQELDGLVEADPEQPRWLAEKLGLLSDTLRWVDFFAVQEQLRKQFPGTAEAKLAEALTPGMPVVRRLHLLDAAIQRDAEFVKLYYYRAQTYRLLNMEYQAIQDFSKCLELAPGYYEVYLWRARTATACGLSHAALKDLMTYFVSPICKQRARIYEEIITVLEQMKKLDLAFEIIFNKHTDAMEGWDGVPDGQQNP